MRTLAKWTMAAVVGIAVASNASAQSDPADASQDLLRGPAVKDVKVPGVQGSFGTTPPRNRGVRIRPDAVRKVLDEVLGENAPAETRATPEQRAAIAKLVKSHQDQTRQFQRTHGQELKQLRRAQRGSGRSDRPLDQPGVSDRRSDTAMDGMDDMASRDAAQIRAGRQKAAARLTEIQAQAPKTEALLARIWSELREPQRAAVESKIETIRTEQLKKQEERYVERRLSQRQKPDTGAPRTAKPTKPETDRPAMTDAAPDRARRNPRDQQHRRLIALFDRLPEGQQRAVLERLEQLAGNTRGDRATPRRKPAPTIDGVKVPKPDKDG